MNPGVRRSDTLFSMGPGQIPYGVGGFKRTSFNAEKKGKDMP